jgi:hypothetical protein
MGGEGRGWGGVQVLCRLKRTISLSHFREQFANIYFPFFEKNFLTKIDENSLNNPKCFHENQKCKTNYFHKVGNLLKDISTWFYRTATAENNRERGSNDGPS